MSSSPSASRHPFAAQWNHNSHYYPRIAELLDGRHLVLDVGCGDGSLARFLATGQVDATDREIDGAQPAQSSPEGTARHEVLGIDIDAPALPKDGPGTHFVLADGQQLPYPAGSFDAVVCVAALHHMNARLALAEMRRVLRPGGRIVVLGLARRSWRPDHLVTELRDVVLNAWWRQRAHYVEADTLTAKPELGWADTRALLERALPGVDVRRVPLWRWLAVWDAPQAAG
ncbi:Methyltransferase domain-containing protein [Propionibacterium cyclohexanicum]|uniref:Methyltransferase domain-containing protein n=1 Tax=Propionibacterium cyclohexanicum TaxID=64702 RepID=A0A1H9SLX6_9ACTN|nr:class I SAM-dependent methyltransferase [Propionibacterium cyclohexanicum]SER85888.1 Methyltransferase domain-containing protein [Propionibacterium cyclohexanicum]